MTSVIEISNENFEAYLDAIMEIERLSFPTPWSRNSFAQEFKNPISHVWAALTGNVLSAYICFWMFASEIQVINIAVHPEKRGKGLGTRLLKRMIDTGTLKGMHQVWLEVRTSNLLAKRLYDGLGFIEMGRRPGYYRDTQEDAIVMTLVLSERQGFRKVSN